MKQCTPKCVNIITAFSLHRIPYRQTGARTKSDFLFQTALDARLNYTHVHVHVHVQWIYVSGLLALRNSRWLALVLGFWAAKHVRVVQHWRTRSTFLRIVAFYPKRNCLSEFQIRPKLVSAMHRHGNNFRRDNDNSRKNPHASIRLSHTHSSFTRSLIYCIRTIMQINPQFHVIEITWRSAPWTERDTQPKKRATQFIGQNNTKVERLRWRWTNEHIQKNSLKCHGAFRWCWMFANPYTLCRNTPMLFQHTCTAEQRPNVSSTQTICPFICKSIRIILRYSVYD